MAKNSIRDYSATNSANTDIQSIDISEGCSPAGINNAIREVMADLKDVSTGAVALESPAMDSASLTGNLTFGDSAKATFGTGSDFEIFHDGSNTYLTETGGVGNVYLRANNLVLLNNANEAYVDCVSDGAVTLYHDNAVKLATTATGVDVTGDATVDRVVNSGVATTASTPTYTWGGQQALTGMYLPLANTIAFSTNATERMRIESSGNLIVGGTYASAPGSIMLQSNGDITSILASGAGGNTLISAISGVSNGYQISVDASNNQTYKWHNGGAQSMTLDSSGNLGIGGTTASTTGFVRSLNLEGSDVALQLRQTTTNTSWEIGNDNTGLFRILSNGSNRLVITGSGTTLFGCSTFPSASVQGFAISGSSSGQASSSGSSTAAYNHLLFYNGNGLIGYIATSGSTTTYANISDYRLKTDVTYDWDATTRLKQLKPARFAWIADGDDAVPVDGFLAHEVQDIVPEAIVGEKDGMRDEEYEVSAATGDIYTPATDDADEVIHSADVEQPEELAEGQQWRETTAAVMGTRSVPDYQGIDQSKLVPLLVKTIQELEARITALEAN